MWNKQYATVNYNNIIRSLYHSKCAAQQDTISVQKDLVWVSVTAQHLRHITCNLTLYYNKLYALRLWSKAYNTLMLHKIWHVR